LSFQVYTELQENGKRIKQDLGYKAYQQDNKKRFHNAFLSAHRINS